MKVILCTILLLVGCATTNSEEEQQRKADQEQKVMSDLNMMANLLCQLNGGVDTMTIPAPKEDDPNTYTAHVTCINGVSGNAWVTLEEQDEVGADLPNHPHVNPKL